MRPCEARDGPVREPGLLLIFLHYCFVQPSAGKRSALWHTFIPTLRIVHCQVMGGRIPRAECISHCHAREGRACVPEARGWGRA
jgi:hypothetical protein